MEPGLLQLPGVVIGEVTDVTADGRPLVRSTAAPAPRPAQTVHFQTPPDWTTCVGVRVVVAFVDGDPGQPVVLGLLDAPRQESTATPRSLRIAAGQELVIECGKSKILLRADGRVEIRGEHLVSRATGPNKVKGGSVHIN